MTVLPTRRTSATCMFAAGGEVHDHLPQSGANDCGQVGAVEGGANPAHDVGTKGGLGIEQGLDGKNISRSQVNHLGGDGGCAEVDGDAEARFSRRCQV